jgi:hypothetical protein
MAEEFYPPGRFWYATFKPESEAEERALEERIARRSGGPSATGAISRSARRRSVG